MILSFAVRRLLSSSRHGAAVPAFTFVPAFTLPALILVALMGIGLTACSSSKDDLPLSSDMASLPPDQLYNAGVDSLQTKRYADAVKRFDAVEQNYPYASWATKAQLMHGYAEYKRGHYTDAIGALERYIQLHPSNPDSAYAYYLRALCYYEEISDIQRDQSNTEKALSALNDVVNRYPETSYARDARLKIDLCRDHLAGKEMEVGRWYEGQHLYVAALERFQTVITDYQTTNHVPEALERVTEVYLAMGLPDEARKTATVLGYNYPGNEWYQKAYDLLVTNGVVPDKNGKIEKPGFFSRIF